MNADVEKAVEVLDANPFLKCEAISYNDSMAWQTIRQALRDQDSELQMLRAPFAIEDATAGSHWFGEWVGEKRRREKSEALLREFLRNGLDAVNFGGGEDLRIRITAHLGAEQ